MRPKPLRLTGARLRDAAGAICSRLADKGHDPVLVGRACAEIYGGSGIGAEALEFAVRDFSEEEIAELMGSMGFSPKERRTYSSKACSYDVILAPAPVVVGDDIAGSPRALRTAEGTLQLLTPTDCVRQRLSLFYRCGDGCALQDAVRVARRQKVDMDLVRRWSEWEWAIDRFERFLKEISRDG